MRSDPITGPAPEEAGRLADDRSRLADRLEHLCTDDRYSHEAVGILVCRDLDTILAALRSAGGDRRGESDQGVGLEAFSSGDLLEELHARAVAGDPVAQERPTPGGRDA